MCPVLTVQSSTTVLGAKRILLPFDSSPHTRDKVKEATAMALAFDAEVLIKALITPSHKEEKVFLTLKLNRRKSF